ncbi:unnamed protein product [Durusdinium trenchii]|uniref:Phosducin thioredoxin-like domain-containing protein n=1 Tax=Durusdinium trenchii TaxID=1381693 RepID=A0ABP0SSE9_9DINO
MPGSHVTMAAPRSRSRSPRPDSCFEMNARWWSQPGSKKEANALSDYDRDDILKENPLAQGHLVALNQHVITCDSQDSKTQDPMALSDEWYVQTAQRRPNFQKELKRHQKRGSKVLLLQRAYVEMLCRSVEQAKLIIESVDELCFFLLTKRDASQECSSIFDELNTSALPLTALIFPDRKIGQAPLFFVVTNMFRGCGREDIEDLHCRTAGALHPRLRALS